MKLKVGDKVRVRKDLEENKLYGEYETYKEQGKYKGMLAIIKRVNKASGYYDLDIDDGENYWTDEMLEPVAETIAESNKFTKEDFKFGDVVTLRNGEQGIISGDKIVYPNEKFDFIHEFNEKNNYLGANKNFDIVKVQRYIKNENGSFDLITLYERKEEILDGIEKKFLNDIIYPYKNRVKCIIKKEASAYPEYSYLRIDVESICEDRGEEKIVLPYFETSKMYKGMENGEPYTLKQLGL